MFWSTVVVVLSLRKAPLSSRNFFCSPSIRPSAGGQRIPNFGESRKGTATSGVALFHRVRIFA